MSDNKIAIEEIKKPVGHKNPQCTVCGRLQELRMGFCFDCANMQAMLIDGNDMYDNSVSEWNKSELLAYIVRKAMSFAKPTHEEVRNAQHD